MYIYVLVYSLLTCMLITIQATASGLKTLSHGPLVRISCVHKDSLIRINMQVKTTFGGGFDPHLIQI